MGTGRVRSFGRRLRRWIFRAVLAGLAFVLLGSALPMAYLRVLPPLSTAFVLRSRLHADPATGERCDRVRYRFVPYERIAPDLALAVLVAEDQRFFLHDGFDVYQVRSAVWEAIFEGRSRGASTLTQQLVKNLFLWPGRSLARKGLEAWLTVWIEWIVPKRRILELYLNVAQFGPCTFGAQAASLHYFDTPAQYLLPEQAAALAAALPSPGRIRVGDPGPYARQRAREILGLIEELRDSPLLEGY